MLDCADGTRELQVQHLQVLPECLLVVGERRERSEKRLALEQLLCGAQMFGLLELAVRVALALEHRRTVFESARHPRERDVNRPDLVSQDRRVRRQLLQRNKKLPAREHLPGLVAVLGQVRLTP